MIGAGANRTHDSSHAAALRATARASRSSPRRWARAWWTSDTELCLGTAALSERDYIHRAIDAGRPDHRRRPRRGGEATVPHAQRRPAGDPHRLLVRASVEPVYFPQARGDRRHRQCDLAARRALLEGKRTGTSRCFFDCARDARAHVAEERRRRFPITPQRLVRDVRARRAGRRHRRAGQRHVQDLVRPRLPHAPAEHRPARQRARDHGRGLALRNVRRAAVSEAQGARGRAATAAS